MSKPKRKTSPALKRWAKVVGDRNKARHIIAKKRVSIAGKAYIQMANGEIRRVAPDQMARAFDDFKADLRRK